MNIDEDRILICSPIIEDRCPIIEDRSYTPLGHNELTLLAMCGNLANGLWPVSGLSGQLSFQTCFLKLR